MPQGKPLDDKTRAAILNDIRVDEKSCRGIAREHGVDPGTVSRIAKQAGITDAFQRGKTKKATEAAQADAASDRASLATASLVVAKRALKRMDEALPQASARDAAVAFGIAVDKHRQLVEMDRDPEGLAAVDAWLRGITGQ
ncbi:winged helix-turn-helix domain-containing protein [Streptosporangium sp. NPDC051022]|uniref:winged helix-turn-helix domain-containing protein n=1 Tax=Streptosporangium sp. NPDC051022 TaxID=3155752 RepID=UPI00341403CD